jgi:hypothetical protein
MAPTPDERPPLPDHELHLGRQLGTEVWKPYCSCGWKSYVHCPTEQLATEQLRKHADRVFKPTIRAVSLSIRIDAGKQTPDDVRELIAIAKTEAVKR